MTEGPFVQFWREAELARMIGDQFHLRRGQVLGTTVLHLLEYLDSLHEMARLSCPLSSGSIISPDRNARYF